MARELELSEATFQTTVVSLAQDHGWRVQHIPKSRTARANHLTAYAYDGKGWPDLFLMHPREGLIVAAELKTKTGRLSDEQAKWRTWFEQTIARAAYNAGLSEQACCVSYYVWRPADWPKIVDVLTLGRGDVQL